MSVGGGVETGVESTPDGRENGVGGLEIRLLGPLEVLRDGQPISLPGSRKLVALLVYLLLARRPVSRSSLCDLLWDGPDDPRSELRWHLSKLRVALETPNDRFLVTNADMVNADLSRVHLDVRTLAEMERGADTLDTVRAALGLCRGAFLYGWRPPKADTFVAWFDAIRDEYQHRQAALLERLAGMLPAADPERIAALRRRAELVPDAPAIEVSDRSSKLPILSVGVTRPAIVVLPFRNVSADRGHDHLADGIVEALVTDLARIRSFFVMTKGTMFSVRSREIDALRAGTELGVLYALAGSVQTAGDRLRVMVRLIDTATGADLWAGRFDGYLCDVFALQDAVSTNVMAAIQPIIRKAEILRAQRINQGKLDGYHLLMQAMGNLYPFSISGTQIAKELLNSCIAVDQKNALAHALLGFAAFIPLQQGWEKRSKDVIERIHELRTLAIRNGGEDAEALAWAAFLGSVYDQDLNEDLDLVEKSILLNSSIVKGFQVGGQLYMYAGNPNKGIKYLNHSLQLDSLSIYIGRNHGLSMSYFSVGQFDNALHYANKGLLDNPHSLLGRLYRISCLGLLGRRTEAEIALRELTTTDGQWDMRRVMDWWRNIRNRHLQADQEDAFLKGLRLAGLPE